MKVDFYNQLSSVNSTPTLLALSMQLKYMSNNPQNKWK